MAVTLIFFSYFLRLFSSNNKIIHQQTTVDMWLEGHGNCHCTHCIHGVIPATKNIWLS